MSLLAPTTDQLVGAPMAEVRPDAPLSIFDAEWLRRDAEGLNAQLDILDNLPEDTPPLERLQTEVAAQRKMILHALNMFHSVVRQLPDRYELKKQPKPRTPRTKKAATPAQIPTAPIVSGDEAA
jgi:hypothetical protein